MIPCKYVGGTQAPALGMQSSCAVVWWISGWAPGTLQLLLSHLLYLSFAIGMHITHTTGYGLTLNILTTSEEHDKWLEMSLQRVPEMPAALAIHYLLYDCIWRKSSDPLAHFLQDYYQDSHRKTL